MEAQEIFDKVVTHLRKQGCKSFDEFTQSCLYRGPNGTSCAVGCLIPDEEYTSAIEGDIVDALIYRFQLPSLIPMQSNIELLGAFQRMHDFDEVSTWEQEFARVANRFNLNYSPI